jgi:hypothetical protein
MDIYFCLSGIPEKLIHDVATPFTLSFRSEAEKSLRLLNNPGGEGQAGVHKMGRFLVTALTLVGNR